MNCTFRFLLTKHLLAPTALSLLVLFSSALSQAQITPSGDSYTNTADPSSNYSMRTMLSYFAAIELAFTILVALSCAAVLALVGVYISNQAQSPKRFRCNENRSSLNLVPPSTEARLLLEQRGTNSSFQHSR